MKILITTVLLFLSTVSYSNNFNNYSHKIIYTQCMKVGDDGTNGNKVGDDGTNGNKVGDDGTNGDKSNYCDLIANIKS